MTNGSRSVFYFTYNPIGHVFLHTRDIRGNILNTIVDDTIVPVARVPSLGQQADRLLDAFGFPSSVIRQLRTSYLDARQFEIEEDAFLHFVSSMRGHGMVHVVAVLFWEAMKEHVAYNERDYRDRYVL